MLILYTINKIIANTNTKPISNTSFFDILVNLQLQMTLYINTHAQQNVNIDDVNSIN